MQISVNYVPQEEQITVRTDDKAWQYDYSRDNDTVDLYNSESNTF